MSRFGEHTINGGTGDDWMIGHYNNDIYVFEADSGQDVITWFTSGSSRLDVRALGIMDFDQLGISDTAEGALITFSPGNSVLIEAVTADYLTEAHFIFATAPLEPAAPELNEITGSGQFGGTDMADLITGSAGNDKINAHDGDDEIHGGDGKDVLTGNGGNDLIHGDKGNDNLYGREGEDTLDGGSNNDKLMGGDGNDVLRGSSGNDKLWGGRRRRHPRRWQRQEPTDRGRRCGCFRVRRIHQDRAHHRFRERHRPPGSVGTGRCGVHGVRHAEPEPAGQHGDHQAGRRRPDRTGQHRCHGPRCVGLHFLTDRDSGSRKGKGGEYPAFSSLRDQCTTASSGLGLLVLPTQSPMMRPSAPAVTSTVSPSLMSPASSASAKGS
ncbi:MAG TPA: hypothetical protein DEA05_04660 [Rhodobacteraceae bacterium]|nr:hypothetical protein [Paracoccaceae bacterium]